MFPNELLLSLCIYKSNKIDWNRIGTFFFFIHFLPKKRNKDRDILNSFSYLKKITDK